MITADKKALRNATEEKKMRLDEATTLASDRGIAQNLLALPEYREAETIFCFVSRPDEIDTAPILEDALARGKRVCAPRCIAKGVMEAYAITGPDDLETGKYGIREPKEGCPRVDAAEIDFVVVPCATCDTAGNRLGYGGGFYDRYLRGRPFVKAVVCRSALLSDAVPTEEHDVVADILVTDRQVTRPR